jgi:porin
MFNHPKFIALLLSIFCFTPNLSQADDPSNGVEGGLSYTLDSANNLGGGIQTGQLLLHKLSLTGSLNTQALGAWNGGTLFVELLGDHGHNPSNRLYGDFQTADNIADQNRMRVEQFWYQQQILNNRLAVLFGIHNLNSEFDVTHYGGLFLNSSFGISPEISGNVASSIFPETGMAVMLTANINDQLSLKAATYDGQPNTRKISHTEGFMHIMESAWASGDTDYKLGIWHHTQADTAKGIGGLSGAYVVVDQPLPAISGIQLGSFLQYGIAQPGKASQLQGYQGAGLTAQGLIPGRPEDLSGIGIASAHFSTAYLNANPGYHHRETTLEITYQAMVTPWLSLQPSYQYIKHPSGDPSLKAAQALIMRLAINL